MRPFEPADLDAATALVAACYGDRGPDRGRWSHAHFGNAETVSGMMVAAADGALVGMQPMECFPFMLAGEPLLGAVLTGVMVHPGWRRRGIFLALLEACERRAWELGAAFVTTMPNEQSRPGFVKRGYTDPGERTLMVLPLARPSRPEASGSGSGWAGAALRLGARVSAANRRLRRATTADACGVDRFGREVAEMMRRAAEQWPGLIQLRSEEWLSWRYPCSASGDYRRWVAGGGSGLPEAAAVTARERRRGLEVGYLVDLVGLDEGAAAGVAAAACRGLSDEGAELVIAVVSCRQLVQTLRRVGFRTVPPWLSPKHFYTVYRPAPGQEGRLAPLQEIGCWYQTLGDWDTV